MRNLFFLLIIFLGSFYYASAQRFVYVDSEYILDRMPDYKKAQEQIDLVAEEWRKEIDLKYKEIEKMRKAYQAEEVLLTEDMKVQKQKEIEEKEKAARDLQKQRFGYQGDLFTKKQELIKPIQDKVYKEIQTMAETKAYDFVFDKSNGPAMMYATPKYDRSDDILKALGITNLNPAAQQGADGKPNTGSNKPQIGKPTVTFGDKTILGGNNTEKKTIEGSKTIRPTDGTQKTPDGTERNNNTAPANNTPNKQPVAPANSDPKTITKP